MKEWLWNLLRVKYWGGNTGIRTTTEKIKQAEIMRFLKLSIIPNGISLYWFLLWMKSSYSLYPKVGPATLPAKKKTYAQYSLKEGRLLIFLSFWSMEKIRIYYFTKKRHTLWQLNHILAPIRVIKRERSEFASENHQHHAYIHFPWSIIYILYIYCYMN